MGALTAVVPFPYRVAAILIFAAALLGFGWVRGATHVQAKWDAEHDKQFLKVAHVQQKQAEATVKIVTQYVDRVKIVHETGDTIIKEVPKYVPSDSCALPAGFRVLHDAAANNTVPDPAGRTDAQPVPAQDAATTVATNYQQYYELAAQLKALQDWIRAQEAATNSVSK